MKTKILLLLTCTFLLSLLVISKAMGQEPKNARQSNSAAQQAASNPAIGNYSFRLFTAPNNAYGYDILKDGKPVFHQFVLTFIGDDGKRIFVDKTHAQKAATLAISKIKKGIHPSLSDAEIKNIAEH